MSTTGEPEANSGGAGEPVAQSPLARSTTVKVQDSDYEVEEGEIPPDSPDYISPSVTDPPPEMHAVGHMNDWGKKYFKPEPEAAHSQDYYYTNFVTGQSVWEEPTSGFQWTFIEILESWEILPGHIAELPVTGPLGYRGFNGKIHEKMDHEAPYMQYHHWLDERRAAAKQGAQAPQHVAPDYSAVGTFNRFTGAFQRDQNPERHNDDNKSQRQLSQFMDIHKQANSHGGRSLKEERRNTVYTAKEIQAFKVKKQERKKKRQADWLK